MGHRIEIDWQGEDGSTHLYFFCPACNERHTVLVYGPNAWTFNNNFDLPTLTPSILVTSGHYADGDDKNCWCTWDQRYPNIPVRFKCYRCHSFVKDGKIQFLIDSTHAMAGQTLDLPDLAEIGQL
jgi:hypothetical protein